MKLHLGALLWPLSAEAEGDHRLVIISDLCVELPSRLIGLELRLHSAATDGFITVQRLVQRSVARPSFPQLPYSAAAYSMGKAGHGKAGWPNFEGCFSAGSAPISVTK